MAVLETEHVGTTYEDTTVVGGVTYQYTVIPNGFDGVELFSNEIEYLYFDSGGGTIVSTSGISGRITPTLAFDITIDFNPTSSSASGTVIVASTITGVASNKNRTRGTVICASSTTGVSRDAERARGTVNTLSSVAGYVIGNILLSDITINLTEPIPDAERAYGNIICQSIATGRAASKNRARGTINTYSAIYESYKTRAYGTVICQSDVIHRARSWNKYELHNIEWSSDGKRSTQWNKEDSNTLVWSK